MARPFNKTDHNKRQKKEGGTLRKTHHKRIPKRKTKKGRLTRKRRINKKRKTRKRN